MNNAEEKTLKTGEAAARLKCGTDKVLDLIDKGLLRGYKLGPKSFRIYESSITEYIKNNEF